VARETAVTHFILDSSVIVKWFSTSGEADTKSALWLRQALFENRCRITIPDLVLYELGNALRFNQNYRAEDVIAAIHSLLDMNLIILAVEPGVVVYSVQLAFQHAVTLYDAYFLALAAKSDYALVTADYKFHQKVKELKYVIRLDKLLKVPSP
jgi:predicted nucleic acid-binding protein